MEDLNTYELREKFLKDIERLINKYSKNQRYIVLWWIVENDNTFITFNYSNNESYNGIIYKLNVTANSTMATFSDIVELAKNKF